MLRNLWKLKENQGARVLQEVLQTRKVLVVVRVQVVHLRVEMTLQVQVRNLIVKKRNIRKIRNLSIRLREKEVEA